MPARAQVLAYVARYPGVHVREMERQLGLPSRLAAYHLDQLEREGQVQRLQEPGYTRFFPSVGRPRWSRDEMAFLSLMRHAVALRIVLLLLSEGPTPQGALAKRLRLAKASTSYHLSLLVKAGLIDVHKAGRQRLYRVRDEDRLRGLLANFTPIPDDLDTFTAIWNDLFG